MIAARGVQVRAGGRALLDGVSLDLAPGEVIAVVGANGAGKSTLLRVLAGERRPDAGKVTLDGTPLAQWPARMLAQRRAVLPQAAQVAFSLMVHEVVSLGRVPHRGSATRVEDRRAVSAALEAVGLQAMAGRLYHTLSGGERQRVHLARVLAQIEATDSQPRFVLLDEPTAGLDLPHQAALMALVRSLAQQGRAVLVVLHELNQAAAVADRVLVLHGGRVAALGEPDSVLTPAVLRQAFDIEATLIALPEGGRYIATPASPGW